MMSDKIDWTKNLGDAVLAQQPDVMDAIQRLRALAHARNKLVTNKQQKVSVQQQENQEVIVIEQAQPDTVYVPYYDPATVYGDWPYAEYPPYYFGYPSYIGAGVVAAGLAFGAGWAIRRWGNYWGGGCNWGSRNLYVNHYNRTTSSATGSTIRRTVRASGITTPALRRNSATTTCAPARRIGWITVAAMARKCSTPERIVPARVIVLVIAQAPIERGPVTAEPVIARKAATAPTLVIAPRQIDGAKGGDRAREVVIAPRPTAAALRGAGNKGGRDTAIRNVSSGKSSQCSVCTWSSKYCQCACVARQYGGGGRGGGGGAGLAGGGRGGGGGFGGGGGRGGGGGGGGRRSDIALKHDVVLLGNLDNGLGYYRFSYLGSDKAYVGVMAQEVQAVMPGAVTRGGDGYLRVHYDRFRAQVPHLQGLARGRRADPHARM